MIFLRNNHILNIKVVQKHHMFGSPCTVRLTILSWCTIIRPAPGTTHHSLDQHLSLIMLRSSLIPCSCWRSLNRKQQNQFYLIWRQVPRWPLWSCCLYQIVKPFIDSLICFKLNQWSSKSRFRAIKTSRQTVLRSQWSLFLFWPNWILI